MSCNVHGPLYGLIQFGFKSLYKQNNERTRTDVNSCKNEYILPLIDCSAITKADKTPEYNKTQPLMFHIRRKSVIHLVIANLHRLLYDDGCIICVGLNVVGSICY